MFTINGQAFETVAIARLVVQRGWTHVPAAAPDADGNVVGGCNWAVERTFVFEGDDDWPTEVDTRIVDCGAEVAYDDHHWVCAAGHEHTSMEAQEREGWAYAEDEYDAAVIAKGGRTPVPMGPNTHIDEHVAARIMATL